MIDTLLVAEPFSLGKEEKDRLFLSAMKESLIFHYENCEPYREFCSKRGFNPHNDFSLPDVPFLPVQLFKDMKLISVPEGDILRNVHSSSTASGRPSSVYLDKLSMKRQTRALTSIMESFLGKERRDFIFLDSPETIKSGAGELSSRATVMRSLLPFSKHAFYILDNNLELDKESLTNALKTVSKSACFFGFTFILYQFIKNTHTIVSNLFTSLGDSIILHSGGWKKLENMKIEKPEFNKAVAQFFKTTPTNVIDLYGMVEHLGILYPDCEYGYKHVPAFSDIIIRSVTDLKPVESGTSGFIQLLSPIPHSYPGVSIISDDIGRIIMDDGCRCGRRGKAFLFESRAEKAEPRGCGDTARDA